MRTRKECTQAYITAAQQSIVSGLFRCLLYWYLLQAGCDLKICYNTADIAPSPFPCISFGLHSDRSLHLTSPQDGLCI